MSFSALDHYYVKLFEVNLDFFFFYCYKTFEQYGKTAHHTLEQSAHCSIHFTYYRSELE
jgi:hypothetical protein